MNTFSIWNNDIILEIHALRQLLAEEYQNDLYAYSQAAVSHCLSLGFEFTESPRRSRKTATSYYPNQVSTIVSP